MTNSREVDKEKERAIKTVAKSGSFLFIALIISRFLGYLTRISLARFLGPSDMGLVYLAASVSGVIATISTFGLPVAVQKFVSYYEGKNNLKRVKGVITSSLKISFPISLISAFLLFIFSDWLAINIFHKPVLAIGLKIFSLAIPFRIVLRITDASTKAFRKIKYHAYTRKIIEPVSKLVLVLLFIFLGYKMAAGVLGYSIGFMIASIASFYFLEKKVFPILKTKVKAVSLKRKLLNFSWPLMITGILWILVGQIDTIMIGSLIKEARPLGIYQAALPTSQLLFIIPMALTSLFLPVISNLLSKNKLDEVRDIYKITSKWIFYFNFPILLILLSFPKEVLNTLFGSEFLSGGIVLSVLSIGFFINSFGRLSRGMINLIEKTKIHLLNSSAAVLLVIVLNYVLIPRFGILGAAIATSTSFLTYALMEIIETYYFTNSLPFKFDFLKSFAAAIISCGLVIWIKDNLLGTTNILNLIILFFIFISGYLGLLLLFRGLGEEDILILKSLERKTGFRSERLRNFIKKFI